MNQSLLVLAIAASMILVGCGGSSDGKNTITSKGGSVGAEAGFDDYVTYDFSPVSRQEAPLAYRYNFKKIGDILYVKSNDSDVSYRLGSFFLTEDNLYRKDETQDNNGYKFKRFLSSSSTKLVTTPYSLDGYKDLQITLDVKWIDLSGQPVADRTNIYSTYKYDNEEAFSFGSGYLANSDSMVSFIKSSKKTTFPQGASCFKIISETANKPYIEFSPHTIFTTTIDQWISVEIQNGFNQIDQGVWAGYSWATSKSKDIDYYTSAIVNYNNNSYFGELLQSRFLKDEIAELKKEVSKSNGSSVAFEEALLKEAESECDGYNKIAASTIDQLISKAIE